MVCWAAPALNVYQTSPLSVPPQGAKDCVEPDTVPAVVTHAVEGVKVTGAVQGSFAGGVEIQMVNVLQGAETPLKS